MCPSARRVVVKSRVEDNKDTMMIKTNVTLSMKIRVVNYTLDKDDKISECCTEYLSFDAASKELSSYP